MSNPVLTIIIPTQGRLTLGRALESIRNKTQPLHDEIEILVCVDTHSPLYSNVAQITQDYKAQYLEFDAGFHGWGHPQAEYAYPKAKGRYILALGDDDQYVDGALGKVINLIEANDFASGGDPFVSMWQVIMYRSPTRQIRNKWTIWSDKTLNVGTVTGQNICLPNNSELLVPYPSTPTGDRDFIVGMIEVYGGLEEVIWMNEVIATCH